MRATRFARHRSVRPKIAIRDTLAATVPWREADEGGKPPKGLVRRHPRHRAGLVRQAVDFSIQERRSHPPSVRAVPAERNGDFATAVRQQDAMAVLPNRTHSIRQEHSLPGTELILR